MKFYFTCCLLLCIAMSASANDLTITVKNTIKGGSTGTIDLSISGGTAPYKISWTGPNGFTAATEDINNLSVGVYTVTVNDAYCGTITTTITVTDFLTSIDELDDELISLFPNPTTADVEIKLSPLIQNYQLRVLNTLGEIVANKNNMSETYTSIDLQRMDAGVYFVEIIKGNKLWRRKVIKY